MVFSALVDADFLDTEEHFSQDKVALRGSTVTLQSLWEMFENDQNRISKLDDSLVNQICYAIYQACLASAEQPQGLFKLTVPTGGGKTRSGLGFALKHGIKHKLKRIIVAVPFTTITEQTANEYRKIFESVESDNQQPIVLEHHSAYAPEEGDSIDVENGDFQQKAIWNHLSAENWDAPLIVTTTVQLLERPQCL
jgi:CRISPR-associated endonuclease/helicase Cas3